MERLRYDSAMFWLAFGTAAAVIGLALMTIGVTRSAPGEDLLASAWFDGGLALLVAGALLLLWALWLYFLHRRGATAVQAPGTAESTSKADKETAQAEAMRGYYREREKMMDTAMRVWEKNETERRKKKKKR
jgi:hypothetical protein